MRLSLHVYLQVSAQIPKLATWQNLVASSSRRVTILNTSFPVCNFLKGGLSDLYLGLAGAVCTTLPSAFLFFATDEACKQYLEKHCGKDR